MFDFKNKALLVYNRENLESSVLDSGSIVYEFEETINLDEDEEREKERRITAADSKRKKSIKLDFCTETIEEEKRETDSEILSKNTIEKEEEFLGEGYLLKKLQTKNTIKPW